VTLTVSDLLAYASQQARIEAVDYFDPRYPRPDEISAWRRDRASEQHVPPYVIFQDKTLLEIAHAEPGDLTSLGALPGVGQSKLDRYGKGVLETLGSLD
jgi:ATP-dependent DNA helicase RecQ